MGYNTSYEVEKYSNLKVINFVKIAKYINQVFTLLLVSTRIRHLLEQHCPMVVNCRHYMMSKGLTSAEMHFMWTAGYTLLSHNIKKNKKEN